MEQQNIRAIGKLVSEFFAEDSIACSQPLVRQLHFNTLHQTLPTDHALAAGTIILSGGRWNAPEYGGLLLLEAVGKGEFLLVGIEWERGWRYRIEKDSGGTWLSVDVADLSHDMASGEKLSTPRVFLGLAQGDLEQAFLTARHYLQRHVFPAPLKNWPWVVYDFWATEAEGVEEALLREVEFSAKLGVDIFVHDASWYRGSSKKGTGDWGCGLGSYQDDRDKFPAGLAAISQKIHQSGMKFGLWVGPNVVDSRLVGASVPKQWIAQQKKKNLPFIPTVGKAPSIKSVWDAANTSNLSRKV